MQNLEHYPASSTTPKHLLVVEGGGMRGIFVSGILDAFLAHQFHPFDAYVGVSAGSTNLASFLAKQQGRAKEIYLDHSLRPQFINYTRFLKGGDLLDMRWLWDIVEQKYPLDQNTLFRDTQHFHIVVSHAIQGNAHYMAAQPHTIIDTLLASSTLPIITRNPVIIDQQPYFDGGVADALPVQWALKQHAVDKLMVIRTKPKNFIKKDSKLEKWSTRLAFRQTPAFYQSVFHSYARYNDAVAVIRKNNHLVLEINPPENIKISGRLSTNKQLLQHTYHIGYQVGLDAMRLWEKFYVD